MKRSYNLCDVLQKTDETLFIVFFAEQMSGNPVKCSLFNFCTVCDLTCISDTSISV